MSLIFGIHEAITPNLPHANVFVSFFSFHVCFARGSLSVMPLGPFIPSFAKCSKGKKRKPPNLQHEKCYRRNERFKGSSLERSENQKSTWKTKVAIQPHLAMQHLYQLPHIAPVHHQHIAAILAHSHGAVRTRVSQTIVLDRAGLAGQRMLLVARHHEAVVARETLQLVRLDCGRGKNGSWGDRPCQVVAHREVAWVTGARASGRRGGYWLVVEDGLWLLWLRHHRGGQRGIDCSDCRGVAVVAD